MLPYRLVVVTLVCTTGIIAGAQPTPVSEAVSADQESAAHGSDAGESVSVHPGILIISGGIRCTAGFVLSDKAGAAYVVTAGHCLRIGGEVFAGEARRNGITYAQGPVIGNVVAREDSSQRGDWGLIRLDPAVTRPSGSVEFWTGPATAGSPTQMRAGDRICYYGQNPEMAMAQTRARCGFYAGDASRPGSYGAFGFTGAAWSGDSGGPIIDAATGKAVGIIVGMSPASDAGIMAGMSIAEVLKMANQDYGLRLDVVGAPFAPPHLPIADGEPVMVDEPRRSNDRATITGP